jgi:hypothetical protein
LSDFSTSTNKVSNKSSKQARFSRPQNPASRRLIVFSLGLRSLVLDCPLLFLAQSGPHSISDLIYRVSLVFLHSSDLKSILHVIVYVRLNARNVRRLMTRDKRTQDSIVPPVEAVPEGSPRERLLHAGGPWNKRPCLTPMALSFLKSEVMFLPDHGDVVLDWTLLDFTPKYRADFSAERRVSKIRLEVYNRLSPVS